MHQTWFLACVICVLSFIYWYIKQKWKYKSLNKIPGPPGLPIIGNVFDVGTNSTDQLKCLFNLQLKYGNIYKLWVGPTNLLLVVSDPDIIERFLTDPKLNYKDFLYNLFTPWLGKGLLLVNGSYWQRHRKILNPAFHFEILKQFLHVFHANGNILLDNIAEKCKKNNKIDLHNFVNNYALDMICETSMGTKINAQNCPEHEYVKANNNLRSILIDRVFSAWKQNDTLFKYSKLYKVMNESLDVANNFVSNVIQNRQKILPEIISTNDEINKQNIGSKKRIALLDIILKSAVEEQAYTDKEILDEVNNFMFAGHDTTSSTALFTLYSVAKYPNIQKNVFEEISMIFDGDNTKELTMKDFQEMKYTERVIKETLRYYPAAPFFSRTVEKDMMYKDTFLPQGTVLIIFVYGLHRDPKHFKDPDVFNPDRFLPENLPEIKNFTYIPFSVGPRNCIGQKFAMLELKSFLAKVIFNYEVSLAEPTKPLVLSAEGVLKYAGNILFKFKKRKL